MQLDAARMHAPRRRSALIPTRLVLGPHLCQTWHLLGLDASPMHSYLQFEAKPDPNGTADASANPIWSFGGKIPGYGTEGATTLPIPVLLAGNHLIWN